MPRITITEPEKNPQPYRFDLDTETVRIGRAEASEIMLTCGSISSFHAEMVRVPGGFELRDLGSTNGITHDEESVDTWMLRDGDQLLLGDVEFHFQLGEDELAVLAGEGGGPEKPLPDMPEVAAAKPPPRPRMTPQPATATGGGLSGWWLVLAFIVLGSASFYAGLSLRHKNETGSTLGEVTRKQLSQPDVSRLATRDPELYSELFIKPSEKEEEELDIVVAPPVPEEVPPEIEGWEDRERPADWEEDAEVPAYDTVAGQESADDTDPDEEGVAEDETEDEDEDEEREERGPLDEDDEG